MGVLLEGVFHQIEEHLGPVEAVAHEDGVFIGQLDEDFGLLAADDGFEALEHVIDAGAQAEGFDLEGSGFAGFQAGDDQHVLDDARDAVRVFAHHGEETPGDLRVLDHVVVEQVFQIAVDDGHGSAQFVGCVGHEVLADLLGLVFGGHVADDDTGEWGRCRQEWAGGRHR